MSNKTQPSEFIRKSVEKHNSKYSYEKVVYIDNKTHVEVTCPYHSTWWVAPSHHLNGKGCPLCATKKNGEKKKAQHKDKFKEKANNVHNFRYGYDDVNYISAIIRVKINCHKHGVFEQTPNSHLDGRGCPSCGKDLVKRKPLTLQQFIEASKASHGNKYDYSQSKYINSTSKIAIICPLHDIFYQSAVAHMIGKGCQKCMRTGYRADKPGSVYILKYENITKIGITNRCVKRRLKDISLSSGKSFELFYFATYKNGQVPKYIEDKILKELRLTYDIPKENFDGYTECFYEIEENTILQMVSQACSDYFIKKDSK